MENSVLFFLGCTASMVVGALVILAIIMKEIFISYSSTTDFVRENLDELRREMLERVEKFDEITKKASDANLSLGKAIENFDMQLKDLNNRVAMNWKR